MANEVCDGDYRIVKKNIMYIHHSFQIINVTIANGGGLETVGQSILNHFELNDNNRKKREKKKKNSQMVF